ncbi:MAG: hypothetical protein Q8M26_01610 [Pseudolabrys sp.]|nr:hypothetical protein [Pseudolabrys sp.]
MSDHPHTHAHHHRHAGHAHPPAAIGASILRQSAAGRLTVAAVAVAALWALIFWAMQ